MMGNQLSLFHLSHSPVQELAISPNQDINSLLLQYWSDSQDLAFCMINKLLCTNDLLFAFAEYIKARRLSDAENEVLRPPPHKRFDRLAECLGKLEFSLFERRGEGKVIRTETTVLDFAVDISFDEKEVDELRAFGMQGASMEEVERLAQVIRCYVEPVEADATGEVLPQLEESQAYHPHFAILKWLGISEEAMPNPDDKEAILKAILDSIGESEIKLDWVLSETTMTKTDLLAAGNQAERERLRKALAKDLRHKLSGFYGTNECHRHRCFSPLPVLLTDGAPYLAENGGGSGPPAFWLMDAIASYQSEKRLARYPLQTWRLIVTPENRHRPRSAVLVSGDLKKPIVRQEIDFTEFLLDAETMLYASRDQIETGKWCLIILLPGQY